MWLTPSDPTMEFLSSEEVAELRAAFAEIAQLMEDALHNPAWPINACVEARRIAWKHEKRRPPCT